MSNAVVTRAIKGANGKEAAKSWNHNLATNKEMIKELVVKVIKTCTRYKGTKLNNGKVKSYRTASYFKYIHVNYESPS